TTFYIILGTTNMSFNTTEVDIELKLETQVEPSQVYFNEDVKAMTDIKTESDIGSAITHRFTVSIKKLLPCVMHNDVHFT
ncbi:hypothetical protein XENOCAPTIV_004536, partial [Xenoophorus captivus]